MEEMNSKFTKLLKNFDNNRAGQNGTAHFSDSFTKKPPLAEPVRNDQNDGEDDVSDQENTCD